MEAVILVFIIIGSLLMVTNIMRYIYFVRTTHDVLSAGSKRDRAWKYVALVLLIFFLIGYLSIAIFSEPDMMMAMILFGGSVFVAIVLTLMFNLLETAKERSIDIAEVLVGVINKILVAFMFYIGMGYVSGYFYPKTFFPQLVQHIGQIIPSGLAFTYMGNVVSRGPASKYMLGMLAYSVAFLAIAIAVRKQRTK